MTDTTRRERRVPDGAPTAASTLPSRRRGRFILISVLLLAFAGGAAWLAFQSVSTTVAVLTVTDDVARGEQITAEHIGVLQVSESDAARYIPQSRQQDVVGQSALIDLAANTPLTESNFGELTPSAGQTLVGVPLTPGQLPSNGVTAGAAVTVVATTGSGVTVTDTAPFAVQAEIFSVEFDGNTGTYLVDLVLSSEQAEQVAAIAASGNIALVVEGR